MTIVSLAVYKHYTITLGPNVLLYSHRHQKLNLNCLSMYFYSLLPGASTTFYAVLRLLSC